MQSHWHSDVIRSFACQTYNQLVSIWIRREKNTYIFTCRHFVQHDSSSIFHSVCLCAPFDNIQFGIFFSSAYVVSLSFYIYLKVLWLLFLKTFLLHLKYILLPVQLSICVTSAYCACL